MKVPRYDVWVGETPDEPADPASPEFLDELNADNPHALRRNHIRTVEPPPGVLDPHAWSTSDPPAGVVTIPAGLLKPEQRLPMVWAEARCVVPIDDPPRIDLNPLGLVTPPRTRWPATLKLIDGDGKTTHEFKINSYTIIHGEENDPDA